MHKDEITPKPVLNCQNALCTGTAYVSTYGYQWMRLGALCEIVLFLVYFSS